MAQKCKGVCETTPVSSFGGPEIPETAGESSGAEAQSGGGTPLVSALGALPSARGGVGSLGRVGVVGKAEGPGASSRRVCTAGGGGRRLKFTRSWRHRSRCRHGRAHADEDR